MHRSVRVQTLQGNYNFNTASLLTFNILKCCKIDKLYTLSLSLPLSLFLVVIRHHGFPFDLVHGQRPQSINNIGLLWNIQ